MSMILEQLKQRAAVAQSDYENLVLSLARDESTDADAVAILLEAAKKTPDDLSKAIFVARRRAELMKRISECETELAVSENSRSNLCEVREARKAANDQAWNEFQKACGDCMISENAIQHTRSILNDLRTELRQLSTAPPAPVAASKPAPTLPGKSIPTINGIPLQFPAEQSPPPRSGDFSYHTDADYRHK